MPITAKDLCLLASELVTEHGAVARAFAQRASATCAAEGNAERAHFWLTLSVLLEDIEAHRLEPGQTPTIQ
ncbi:MAG: hypothetical protein KGJ78_01525 [Alphaproteobacteria bacterium]|nr:hypothetical protein [Alphaproteobacteria bacterium]